MEGKSVSGRTRVLFFDVVRILAVALLLVHHTAPGGSPFTVAPALYDFIYDNGKFLTYYITSGPIGVYLLVFVSGAVLYMSHAKKHEGYGAFLWARMRRLYPAYWLTLLLFLLIAPEYILPGKQFLAQLTGFLPGASYFQWWIGLFMSLYLVFPLIYKALNKYPKLTLTLALLVTILSRILLAFPNQPFLGFPAGVEVLDRILFTNFLFEFTLGMAVMKYGWYPKKRYSSTALFYIADVSYFVFLVHQPIRLYLASHNSSSFWALSSLVPYLCTVLVVATLLMFFDGYLQRALDWVGRRSQGLKLKSYYKKIIDFFVEYFYGGEGEIRTRGELPHAGFQDQYHQPLGHLSKRAK